MIDLHLHLDGSLSPEDIIRLAKKQKIKLPTYSEDELKKHLTAPEHSTLAEYLTKFDIPLAVLQTEEAIFEAVYSLLQRLKEKGVIYAEIGFAPQLHTKCGLDQRRVVNAACRGLEKGTGDFDIMAKLILCCMRFENNECENIETVELAKEFSGKGVCAADLAGAEAVYKTDKYKRVFETAKKACVPFTIHAGEADGSDSVKAAIEMGAARLGHGVRAADDTLLLKYLADNKIYIEMCPTSNVQTGAVNSVAEHPILDFLEKEILVCVNSDNMTVSDTDVFKEFEKLHTILGMNGAQRMRLIKNAVDASFTSKEEKEILYKKCNIK